jgi:hypothetical protein
VTCSSSEACVVVVVEYKLELEPVVHDECWMLERERGPRDEKMGTVHTYVT